MAEHLLRKGSQLVPNERASSPTDTSKLDGLSQICALFLPLPVPSSQDKNERKRSNSLQDGGNAKKAKTSLQHPQMVMKENVDDSESPSDVLFSPSMNERVFIDKEQLDNRDGRGRGFKASSTHQGNIEHLQIVKEHAGSYEEFGSLHGERTTRLSNTLVFRASHQAPSALSASPSSPTVSPTKPPPALPITPTSSMDSGPTPHGENADMATNECELNPGRYFILGGGGSHGRTSAYPISPSETGVSSRGQPVISSLSLRQSIVSQKMSGNVFVGSSNHLRGTLLRARAASFSESDTIGNEMEMGPNMRRPYRTATRSGSDSTATSTLSLSSFDGTNKIAKVTPDINVPVAHSGRDENLKRKRDHSAKKALFPGDQTARTTAASLKSNSSESSHRLLDQSLKRQASFSPSKNDIRYVSEGSIRSNDVLFGDRDTGLHHPGTLHFQNHIVDARPTYAAYNNDFEKKRSMISTIVETLSQRGRFVRRIGQGHYFLMTEEDVREVVNEALRDRLTAPPSCSSDLSVLTMPPKTMNSPHEGVSGAFHGRMRIGTRRKLPLCQPRTAFSPSTTFRIPVRKEEITNNDILCGREYAGSDHPGNLSYLQMVNDNKASHHGLGCQHGEKTKIRNMIVDEVIKRGGRFVKKEGDRLYLLTQAEARTKVGQSLRQK